MEKPNRVGWHEDRDSNLWVYLDGKASYPTFHWLEYVDDESSFGKNLLFRQSGGEHTLVADLGNRFRVQLTITEKNNSAYLLEYRIANLEYRIDNQIEKRAARIFLESSIRGNNLLTSNVDNIGRKSANADSLFFQGALINGPGGKVVALVPGNGFDNLWTLWDPTIEAYRRAYPACWRSTMVSEKKYSKGKVNQDGVFVTYGRAACGQLSLVIPPGKECVLSVAVGIGRLERQDDLRSVQRFLQVTYFDAFSRTEVAASLSREQAEYRKAMWATAHQLMRIKRFPEGNQRPYLSVPPNWAYAPDFYWEDGAEEVIGLGEPKWVKKMIKSELAFDKPDGWELETDFGGHFQPESEMALGYKIVVPWLLAFAKLRWGIQPDPRVVDAVALRADHYAIDAGELLPYRVSHLTYYDAQVLRGTEGLTYWTESQHGAAQIQKVAAPSVQGVQPPKCSKSKDQVNQVLKMSGTADSDLARTMPVLTVVPSGAHIKVTLQVYLPQSFESGGGIRICLRESHNEKGGRLPADAKVTHSPWRSKATMGWKTFSWSTTTDESTSFIQAGVEFQGNGVAYATDIHVRFDESWEDEEKYRFLHFGLRWTPDQKRCDVLGPMQSVQTSRLLALRCCKEIIGKRWTQVHEDALQGLREVYLREFLKDDLPQFCLWHPRLSDWLELQETVRPPWYMHLLFGRAEAVYSAEQLAGLIEKWPKTPLGPTAKDKLTYTFKVWCKRNGEPPELDECEEVSYPQGEYWNGGSFLNADGMLLQLAKWQHVNGADQKFDARIAKEFAVDYTMHETLCWNKGYTGTSGPRRFGYGRGAALLLEPLR